MVTSRQVNGNSAQPSSLAFRIFDPGETYEEDTRAAKRARVKLEALVESLGGSVELENYGVQAGDHVTYYAAVTGLAGSAVYLWKEAVLPMARAAAKYLAELRELRGGGSGDRMVLQLVAYAWIQRKDRTFVPMMQLDRCLEDGVARHAMVVNTEGDLEGFAVGNHIFSIVDHRRWKTHVIVMSPAGKVLVHSAVDGVPVDAAIQLKDLGIGPPAARRKRKATAGKRPSRPVRTNSTGSTT